jgi:hypothetical protein
LNIALVKIGRQKKMSRRQGSFLIIAPIFVKSNISSLPLYGSYVSVAAGRLFTDSSSKRHIAWCLGNCALGFEKETRFGVLIISQQLNKQDPAYVESKASERDLGATKDEDQGSSFA